MTAVPAPDSVDETRIFAHLQGRLKPLFARILPDPLAPRTVLVVPSMSLDVEELAKITGVSHYEERLLCMLMLLLQLPYTRLLYVTSLPVDPAIVDYYLHLLRGTPSAHARRRLTLLSCHDASPIPLTQKLLERPRLLRCIRDAIVDPALAHMSCFNTTALERTLTVRLGVPVYGCDPAPDRLGSKSGSRAIVFGTNIA